MAVVGPSPMLLSATEAARTRGGKRVGVGDGGGIDAPGPRAATADGSGGLGRWGRATAPDAAVCGPRTCLGRRKRPTPLLP